MTATRADFWRPRALRIGAAVGLVTSVALMGLGAPAVGATAQSATALTWSTVNPATSPPALTAAAAVYDSDNKTVVLFGGLRSNGALSNDTWVWDGSSWTDYPGTAIQAPPARQMAAMAFDPKLHQLILFGGQGASGQPLGDTWAWNGASWYEESSGSESSSPSPREAAAMAYDASGALTLFGGTGVSATSSPPTTTTTQPTTTTLPPSAGTVAAASSGPLISLSDTWRWTEDGWVQSHVAGPSARAGATAAYDAATGQTLLFGGQAAPIGTAHAGVLSDTWAWNGSVWTLWLPPANTKTSPWPAGRVGAALAADPLARSLVLFGGNTSKGVAADTWLWTGSGWSSVRASGAIGARSDAAAAYDANTRQLVVFGGSGSAGRIYGDTVVLGAAPVSLHSGPTTTIPSRSTTPAGGRSAAARAKPPTSTTVAAAIGPSAQPTGASAPTPAPTILHPGDLVRLTGTGFTPGASVTITFHSVPTVVGESLANAAGDFTVTVAVPQSAAAGTHHFEATGAGKSGPVAELLATVDVEILHHLTGTSTGEKLLLVGLALVIPVGTWFGLAGAGWWRRRPRLTT